MFESLSPGLDFLNNTSCRKQAWSETELEPRFWSFWDSGPSVLRPTSIRSNLLETEMDTHTHSPDSGIWRSRRRSGWTARRATGTQTWTRAQSPPAAPKPTPPRTSGRGRYWEEQRHRAIGEHFAFQCSNITSVPLQSLHFNSTHLSYQIRQISLYWYR